MAERHVGPDDTLFYWMPAHLRTGPHSRGIGTRISELNYFLYPAKIRYQHNYELADCRFIICQNGVKSSLGPALQKLGMLNSFVLVSENERNSLYQRK